MVLDFSRNTKCLMSLITFSIIGFEKSGRPTSPVLIFSLLREFHFILLLFIFFVLIERQKVENEDAAEPSSERQSGIGVTRTSSWNHLSRLIVFLISMGAMNFGYASLLFWVSLNTSKFLKWQLMYQMPLLNYVQTYSISWKIIIPPDTKIKIFLLYRCNKVNINKISY